MPLDISFSNTTVNLMDVNQLQLKILDDRTGRKMTSTMRYAAKVAILVRLMITGIISGMAMILLFNLASISCIIFLEKGTGPDCNHHHQSGERLGSKQ